MSDQVVIPAGGALARTSPSDDFNRYIQEMESLIKETEMYLMGYTLERNREGRFEYVQRNEPRVNEAGKSAIMNWLRTYLNPNTYMSLIKSADTRNNFFIDECALADDLVKNHKAYSLTHANFKAIHSKLCFIFFMALKKAETDKEYIFPSMKTNYTPQTGEVKKTGLFGGII